MGIVNVVRRLCGASLIALAVASPLPAETLADAMAFGYESSGLLDQNRALLRAADEDVAQAVSSLLPVVRWVAQAQVSDQPQFVDDSALSASLSLTAEMTLYDGGRNQLAIEVQKEIVLSTRASLLDVEQQIMLRIVTAYLNVQRNGAFVQLRQNNVRLITQELRAARDRFEVGEVTRTDVSLAEARLAAARSLLAGAEGDLAQAQAEYVVAVGRRPQSLSAVPAAGITRSIPEARAIALRTHPALIAQQHNVSAAELNIARAELSAQPTVTLQGTIRLDDEFNNVNSLGVTASGPIYQGGLLASQTRQFIARRDAARSDLIVTSQQIEQNLANAYTVIEVSRASRDAFERQVRAASVAFDGIREEATLGARTTLDVLNAEQELLDARANLISAEIDETLATYRALSAMGLLTAEHLRLRVQIYDPNAYYNLVRDAPGALSDQGRALDRVLEALGEN